MGSEDVTVAVQDAFTNQKLWAACTVKVLYATVILMSRLFYCLLVNG